MRHARTCPTPEVLHAGGLGGDEVGWVAARNALVVGEGVVDTSPHGAPVRTGPCPVRAVILPGARRPAPPDATRVESDLVEPLSQGRELRQRCGERGTLGAGPPGPPGLKTSDPMRLAGSAAGARHEHQRRCPSYAVAAPRHTPLTRRPCRVRPSQQRRSETTSVGRARHDREQDEPVPASVPVRKLVQVR